MTDQRFQTTCRVRLAQTDAAGVVFFTEPLAMAHAAFEALLDEVGVSVAAILRDKLWALPIVEASVQLSSPMRVGDDVVCAIGLERLGTTSFILQITLTVSSKVVARCRTVHVCIDGTGKPTPLPTALTAGLRERLPQAAPASPGDAGG